MPWHWTACKVNRILSIIEFILYDRSQLFNVYVNTTAEYGRGPGYAQMGIGANPSSNKHEETLPDKFIAMNIKHAVQWVGMLLTASSRGPDAMGRLLCVFRPAAAPVPFKYSVRQHIRSFKICCTLDCALVLIACGFAFSLPIVLQFLEIGLSRL